MAAIVIWNVFRTEFVSSDENKCPILKMSNWSDGPFGNIYIKLLLLPFQWKEK